jgi:hypothetical protein
LQNDIAALGTERDFDGAGQLADAAANGFASLLIEGDDFGHGSNFSRVDLCI